MSTPDKNCGEKTLRPEPSSSKELIASAMADTKAVRTQALQNAKAAIESAFNMRGSIISTPHETDAAVRTFLTNAKKTRHEHPELLWISHEASLLLSALIGVSDNGQIRISLAELPEADRELIGNVFEKLSGTPWGINRTFWVKFDKYRNFEVSEPNASTGDEIIFSLGNRVSTTPPNEVGRFTDVKVERKGKEILIGDRIKLERDRIQNLVQPETPSNGQPSRSGVQSRQKVAGRNAYEIRQDIIENAIDVVKLSSSTNRSNSDDITEQILGIAARLYEFVEHR